MIGLLKNKSQYYKEFFLVRDGEPRIFPIHSRINPFYSRNLRVPNYVLCRQITASHPTCLKSILILSSHLGLGIPKGLFPSVLPTKILYAFMNHSLRATCPAHLSRLD